MALRTIEAPGVEIKEIDKSGYSPAMTGTRCYVMGYANKGEPYAPMEFTSKAAWQTYYGDPDNEAERYFYNACSEVINQNGVLYCARLSYDNKAYGKMVGFKYNVGTTPKKIPTANDYLMKPEIFEDVRHDKDYEHDALQYVIDNNILREIDGQLSNGWEFDDEARNFFTCALDAYSKRTGDEYERYSMRYYKLDTSNILSAKFNTLKKANEYISDYTNGKKDVIGDIVYRTLTADVDGDIYGFILPYNYVISATDSSYETEFDEISSLSSTLTGYYEVLSESTHGLVSSDNYLSVNWEKDGFDYESFFGKTASALNDELSLYNNKDCPVLSDLYEELRGKSLSNILFVPEVDKDGKPVDILNDGEFDYDNQALDTFDEVLSFFREKGTIYVADLYEKYGCNKAKVKKDLKYYQVREGDLSVQNYLEITPSQEPVTEDIDKVQAFATNEEKVAAQSFWIFDKTCARLNKIMEDDRKGEKRELVGIFPVVTTAANALYAQSLITVDDEDVVDYESITKTITKDGVNDKDEPFTEGFSFRTTDLVKQFSNRDVNYADNGIMETISREANTYFSTIAMNSQATGFDTENLKKIGVVVFKAYIDPSEGNKVNFTPVEAFCGSLDKDAKNPTTGATTFIDTLVNGMSNYIYFFSNCFGNKTTKNTLNNDTDLFLIKPGVSGMLGFYANETVEEISLSSLYSGIDKCFKNVEDVNERDIDIIPDAGLANIAQYIKSMSTVLPEPMAYDMDPTDVDGNALIGFWKCKSASDLNAWKTVEFKFDNFCKNVRKDCMFIADGPRPMVIQGQKKIVRPSKPTNTIDANILPFVKYATGLNTNYGAGYLDWFLITDEFTGDEFWCPPSIKAMGTYINTDLNFNYWDAPAGLNRGVIQALDVAFSPTIKQAGSIYGKNWNYAINYPNDGIVLEGQKTFQVKPSAFDRVNVRRLFLRLERQAYKIARYFVYEGNTAYTRQRLVDTLDPVFYQAKVGGGLYDYKIVCDESNNTPDSIDRNELKVAIGLKPTKTAEFILIDFIALSTGGSWSEAGL